MAAEPTAQDQYMLELLNRARLNPQAEANRYSSLGGNLNEGVPTTQTISTLPKQALAFNLKLFTAAQSHSQWMLDFDIFDHKGINGSLSYTENNIPGRIVTAGYPTYTTAGENLAWRGTTGPVNNTTDYTTYVGKEHQDLFVDIGVQDRGHRTNMMNPNFREVGTSSLVGIFTQGGVNYNGVMTTQDFATDNDPNAFLTGVVYTDKVLNDDFYTVGEGLGNMTINAVNVATNVKTTTTSLTAGGYSLRLAPGTYNVTFSGDFDNDGKADTSRSRSVVIDTQNVKADFASDTYISLPPAYTRNDFNGDGKADILWRNNDGSIATWQMNGANITPSSVGALPAGWTTAGTGDFNGDRKADILLRNTTTGSVATWQMNGGVVTKSSTIGTLTNGWSIAGTGDFNGDGTSDVLLQNANGSIATWQMNNQTVAQSSVIGTAVDWTVAGVNDFNGDGKSDILLQKTDGTVVLWTIDGASVVNAKSVGTLSSGWSIASTGDLNGDGKADILLRNTNGSVANWQMDGANITATNSLGSAAADWKINGTSDFNGDGKAEILWRNDNGGIAIWQTDGAAILSAGATSIPSVPTSWNIAAPIG